MATYKIFFDNASAMNGAKNIVDEVYGINNVQVVDNHAFMPPYIQFTSTLLSDEGINEHVAKVMVQRGFQPSTFAILRVLGARQVLV